MYQRVPPVPLGASFEDTVMQQFLETLRAAVNKPQYLQSGVNPTAADIDPGAYLVWKNTASGQVRLWANDNGTLKSVLLT